MSLKTLLAGAVALAILTATAGCSDDAPSISTNAVSETTTPIETSMAAPVVSAFPREVLGVTVPAEPRKIVSASATHTEILFALGAGDRIIAVDLFSDYPAETGEKEKIDAYNLNVEAVAAFDPDLVILSFDPGDAVAGLGELGIPVILFSTPPETLQDAYAEMEEVGAAIGADEAAANLVAIIETEVSSIISTIPPGDGDPPTYYHELGEDLYSITSSTFIGTIYSMVGLRNIADPADDYGFGYPQLSAEYILPAAALWAARWPSPGCVPATLVRSSMVLSRRCRVWAITPATPGNATSSFRCCAS